jgi:hypothetical protein
LTAKRRVFDLKSKENAEIFGFSGLFHDISCTLMPFSQIETKVSDLPVNTYLSGRNIDCGEIKS